MKADTSTSSNAPLMTAVQSFAALLLADTAGLDLSVSTLCRRPPCAGIAAVLAVLKVSRRNASSVTSRRRW
jgi:hypothetical protein